MDSSSRFKPLFQHANSRQVRYTTCPQDDVSWEQMAKLREVDYVKHCEILSLPGKLEWSHRGRSGSRRWTLCLSSLECSSSHQSVQISRSIFQVRAEAGAKAQTSQGQGWQGSQGLWALGFAPKALAPEAERFEAPPGPWGQPQREPQPPALAAAGLQREAPEGGHGHRSGDARIGQSRRAERGDCLVQADVIDLDGKGRLVWPDEAALVSVLP